VPSSCCTVSGVCQTGKTFLLDHGQRFETGPRVASRDYIFEFRRKQRLAESIEQLGAALGRCRGDGWSSLPIYLLETFGLFGFLAAVAGERLSLEILGQLLDQQADRVVHIAHA